VTAEASFGGLLRRCRHSAGFTLEELSGKSGVSVRAISNMERGLSLGPQRKTTEAIADALRLAGRDRDALLTAAQAGRHRAQEPAPAVLALPRGPAHFVGRASELAFLAALAGQEKAGPDKTGPDKTGPDKTGPAPVAVVSGPPGVGKTSFAVHASAALADRFPDGQFFVDLRGLDEPPLPAELALGRLIHALDPAQRQLPGEASDRASLLRDILARQRALVVLDNAADEAQVRLLLPGAGPSLVLITSRRLLTGLDGVQRLSLVPLSRTYAVELLTGLLDGRPQADPAAVQRLAELSGNLPLALQLLGNRLASRPGLSLATLIQRLGAQERRLDTLTAGDVKISAVFALSYAQLSRPGQRLFRRLALIPGADTGVAMAAVLSGLPVEVAEDTLDELVEVGLVQSGFSDRYTLHDLLKLFARDRLLDEEDTVARAGVEDAVTGWLLETATVAGRWFEPDFGKLPQDWDERVPMDTPGLAQQWLQTEADNWLAALRSAAARRKFRQVIGVADAMNWFCNRWIHWGHWSEVFGLSAAAAAELGDDLATATNLNGLSWALVTCDNDNAGAVACAQRAFTAAERAGDGLQQGCARSYEAYAQLRARNPAAARAPALEAVRLLEQAGEWGRLPEALAALGQYYEQTGNLEEALQVYQRQIGLATDPATAPAGPVAAVMEMVARVALGKLHVRLRQWAAAAQALAPAEEGLADRVGIAFLDAQMLTALGEALCQLGQFDDGLARLARAEAVYRDMGASAEGAAVRKLAEGATARAQTAGDAVRALIAGHAREAAQDGGPVAAEPQEPSTPGS
jgi:transcriptional regulator with XRE-family HTH domain/tetratricopeptide (TPR) repeat protein